MPPRGTKKKTAKKKKIKSESAANLSLNKAQALYLVCAVVMGAGYQPLGWWRFIAASTVLLAILVFVFRREFLLRTGFSSTLGTACAVLAFFLGLLMADAAIVDSIVRSQSLDISFSYLPFVRSLNYLHSFCQVLNEEIVLRVLLLGLLLNWIKKPMVLAVTGSSIVTLIHIANYLSGSDVFIGWGAVATLFLFNSAANMLYLVLGHNGYGLAFHLAWNLNRFTMTISLAGGHLEEAQSFTYLEGSILVVAICAALALLIFAFYSRKKLQVISLTEASKRASARKALAARTIWRPIAIFLAFLLPSGLISSSLLSVLVALGAPFRDLYALTGIGIILAVVLALWLSLLAFRNHPPLKKWLAVAAFAAIYGFFSFHFLKAYSLWTLDDLRNQGIVLSYTKWAERRPPRSRGSDDFISYLVKFKEEDKDGELSDLAEFAYKVERLDSGVISRLNERKKLIDEAVSLLGVLGNSYFFNPSAVDESPLSLPVYEKARSLVLARLLVLRARQYAQEGNVNASVQDIESTLKLGSAFAKHPFLIEKMIGKVILRIAYKGAARCSSNPSVRQALEPKWSFMMDRIQSNSVLECLETDLIFSVSMMQQMMKLGYADYLARRLEEPDNSWKPGLLDRISLWVDHYSGHRIASFTRYWRYQAKIVLSVDLNAKKPLEKMKAAAHEDQFIRGANGGRDLIIDSYQRMLELENEIRNQAFLLRSVWATQEYRQVYGQWPNQAKDIIEILGSSDLLVDPYGKNGSYIKLKLDKGGLYIYSVGVDGKDDGGKLEKRVDLGYFLPA